MAVVIDALESTTTIITKWLILWREAFEIQRHTDRAARAPGGGYFGR
jgi:hypothetical protein